MPKKAKCKYCGKKVQEVNIQDHEDECSKNPKSKEIKIFSHTITKKQYWFGVLLLIIIYTFFTLLNLPPEISEFEMGEIIGRVASIFLAIFGGLYLVLIRKRD